METVPRKTQLVGGLAAIAVALVIAVMVHAHPEELRAPAWVAYVAASAFGFAGLSLLAGLVQGVDPAIEMAHGDAQNRAGGDGVVGKRREVAAHDVGGGLERSGWCQRTSFAAERLIRFTSYGVARFPCRTPCDALSFARSGGLSYRDIGDPCSSRDGPRR